MNKLISVVLILVSLTSFCQTDGKQEEKRLIFPTLEYLYSESRRIDHENFAVEFLIRTLPDHGWFLEFYADGTYTYKHWNGFSDDKGKILESGKYDVVNNKITLHSLEGISQLADRKFYLFTYSTEKIDNNIVIDCKTVNGEILCLYQN